MSVWNIFRILGDLSHATSKAILISSIHRNQSAEGVSFITQAFYALVFLTRYTDIFIESYLWNLTFKLYYIFSSLYILAIMQFWFPRTRELEVSFKLGGLCLAGSAGLTPFVYMFATSSGFGSFLWEFSQILESVCILPQLLLLRQTSIPTVIDSYYLVTLAAYRGLYVLNWIVRGIDPNDHVNLVSVFFGVIQTALYADFFYVYYSRQRVKLRNGSIIDSDDMDRGWIINRIFGRNIEPIPGNDEENPHHSGSGGLSVGGRASQSRAKWGSRGISISADDDTLEQAGSSSAPTNGHDDLNHNVDPDAKMKDPDELALALNDDSDEERPLGEDSESEDEGPNASKKLLNGGAASRSGVQGGEEWRD